MRTLRELQLIVTPYYALGRGSYRVGGTDAIYMNEGRALDDRGRRWNFGGPRSYKLEEDHQAMHGRCRFAVRVR